VGKEKTPWPEGAGGSASTYVVLAYVRRRRPEVTVTCITPLGYHLIMVAGEWLVMASLASSRSNTDWIATRPGPHIRSHTCR